MSNLQKQTSINISGKTYKNRYYCIKSDHIETVS